MFASHEVRYQGLSRRPVKAACGGTQCRQQVAGPNQSKAPESEKRENARKDRHGCLCGQHQPPPVERIRHHSADQREHDDGDNAHQPDQPERKTLPACGHEQRDVPQYGRRLHHRPGEGDELPPPEQAEVAVPEGDKTSSWVHSHSFRQRTQKRLATDFTNYTNFLLTGLFASLRLSGECGIVSCTTKTRRRKESPRICVLRMSV